MVIEFLPGYLLRAGSLLDRPLLSKFVHHAYHELYPKENLSHLAQTVEQYLTEQTPLWWVEYSSVVGTSPGPIACLWLGNAVDQVTGDRHAHIFLLYVAPPYRRRGIATALIHHAEIWARARGDRQIGLQVFVTNQPAINLYIRLGFRTQSYWMTKPLHQNDL